MPSLSPEPAAHWRLAAAAVLVSIGFAASLVANYPGHFSPDGIWQLAQGREGVFNDWHPPVMAALLGLADRIAPGAWPFVLADAALFYGGLLAFLALEARPRLISLALLAVWLAGPAAFVYQGMVLKDVLAANTALAGFAALAWAGRLWTRPAVRWGLLALAFALLALASLARQNGVVAPVCAAAALAVIAGTRPRAGLVEGGLWRGLAWAGFALGLVAALDLAAGAFLALHGDHHPQTRVHLKVQQVYDLAGAARLDPAISLPILRREQPALEAFVRGEGAAHYRASTIDPLLALPDARTRMAPPGDAVGRQWVAMILSRPRLYLNLRTAVWLTAVMTPPSEDCPTVLVGVDGGDLAMLRRAGLAPRETDKDDWVGDYAHALLGTPLLSHAFWGALVILSLVLNARRWRRGDRDPAALAGIAMAAAALITAASYFVIAVACDYRYLYFLDVAAMAASLQVIARNSGQALRPTTAVARRSSLPQPTR